MTISLAAVSPTRSRNKSLPAANLTDEFLSRASRFVRCEAPFFSSEDALFAWTEKLAGRTGSHLLLLDPAGVQMSSEAFATHLRTIRDSGTQSIVLAVGPADGWTPAARTRASKLLSLGPMTLPHELARVIVAEQVYRALTILAGHPYHCGH